VVGVPDPLFGERVRAVAVLREDRSLPVEELRAWAGARLADYKLPAELITVSELPRNPSGKVLKRQLAGLAAQTPPAGTRR
jgi:fatty-acyl-CoA synthase